MSLHSSVFLRLDRQFWHGRRSSFWLFTFLCHSRISNHCALCIQIKLIIFFYENQSRFMILVQWFQQTQLNDDYDIILQTKRKIVSITVTLHKEREQKYSAIKKYSSKIPQFLASECWVLRILVLIKLAPWKWVCEQRKKNISSINYQLIAHMWWNITSFTYTYIYIYTICICLVRAHRSRVRLRTRASNEWAFCTTYNGNW